MKKNNRKFRCLPILLILVSIFLLNVFSCDLKVTDDFIPPDSVQVVLFPPSDAIIEQLEANTIKINWVDNSWNEKGFKIDKKIGSGSWLISYGLADSNMTSWYDFSVENNILKYRVYGFIGGLNSDYAETEDFYNFIPAPKNLVLNKPDESNIRLIWEDMCDTEDGFIIEKSIGNLDWIENYAVLDSNVTTFLDNIDQICGSFYYRVKAYEGEQFSGYSNTANMNVVLQTAGFLDAGSNSSDIFISSTTNWWLFTADNFNGLTVIDAADPSFNSSYAYSSYNLGGDRSLSVFVVDTLAYVTTHSGLAEHGWLNIIGCGSFMNIYPRELPCILYIRGMCPIVGNPDDTYVPYDIFVEGNYAYIADENNGLSIYNVSNYENPYYISNCSTNGSARHLHVSGDIAYVAMGLSGVAVVDVSDRYNPFVMQTYPTTSLSNEVTILGDFIFVADGDNGLKIIEQSTGAIQYIDTDGFGYSVYVQGQDRYEEDHVYLADKELGLFVIDISDIYNPFILGTLEMDTEPVTIHKFFQSSYVFLTDNEGVKTVQVAP